MKVSFKRSLAISLFVVLLVVPLTTTVFASQDDAAPRYGGSLIVPNSYVSDVETLDPIGVSDQSAEEGQIIIQLNDSLLAINPKNNKIKAAIAKDWKLTEDKKSYIFDLREGVKFHNGTEVTAEDFKYSFTRLLKEGRSENLLSNVVGAEEVMSGKSDNLSGVKVLEKYKLRIDLKEKDVTFLYNLANHGTSVVPKEEVEKLGDQFGSRPVGAGPFKLERWVRGSEIVLTRFDDYYGGKAYLEKVVFKLMPESTTRNLSFRQGNLDYNFVDMANYQQIKKKTEPENLIETTELWTRAVLFNTGWGPLKNKKVRKAINYAIDKEKVIKDYYQGMAYPATGPISSGYPAYDEDIGYNYNPEKAKTLMKEAGYKDGFEIEILGPEASGYGIPAAVPLVPYLSEIGINVKLTTLSWGNLMPRLQEGDFEAYISSVGGKISALEVIKTYTCDTPRTEGNRSLFCDPEFDEYIEEAEKTFDIDERNKIIKQAVSTFTDNAVWFFYNYPKPVIIKQPWVHGLVGNSREKAFQPLDEVWVDESSPRS
ncbi:ABC transporter substrate-binding protein [Candidatus Bipolaricaulota bacterium]|nr:ABC transporter substrate-binding protein [Candidatus Bipolaricaulota bacterium]